MLATNPHASDLIATIAISLSAALVLGVLARRIGVSPIVGYMLAGILVGPHTPGFVADQAMASQLSEIGIALLMFGVGLHFSLDDLVAVRRIAVPGAIGQSALATLAGLGLALAFGWGAIAGLVFGMALSVASTVVLVRGLTDHRALHTLDGHVAVGWLVVEDLFTVVILVLLPVLAGNGQLATDLGLTAVKIGGLAVLYLVGARVVPWFLTHVSRLESRELFTLAVLGIALGVAYGAATLLSVSMALGAFLGGMVVGKSDLSHQAAADALPLRDAFAVLFFVGVGMLFDPGFILKRPWLVTGTVAVVIVVKPLVALAITLMKGYPIRTGLMVAAGLAQIGEFSFIVGSLGSELGLLPPDAWQAIVVAALASITLSPFFFAMVAPLERRLQQTPWLRRRLADQPGPLAHPPSAHAPDSLTGHAVLCGHGRVGRVLGKLAQDRKWPLLVVEQDRALVQRLRADGVNALQGDAANPFVLERTGLTNARILLITLPDPLAARQIIEHARLLNPEIEIVVRVHTEAERDHLLALGKIEVVLGELELAIEMARHTLLRFGATTLEAQATAIDLRGGKATLAGARVLELQVTPGSRADGKHLHELGLGKGVLVMAVDRGGERVVPDGQTLLRSGDTLLVVTTSDQFARVQELV